MGCSRQTRPSVPGLREHARNAYEHFEAAIRTVETSRSELTLPDYKITFLSSLMGFYQDYIDMLIDQGAFDKALQVAESSRSRILAERLGRGKGPEPVAGVQDYAKAARQSKAVFLRPAGSAPIVSLGGHGRKT